MIALLLHGKLESFTLKLKQSCYRKYYTAMYRTREIQQEEHDRENLFIHCDTLMYIALLYSKAMGYTYLEYTGPVNVLHMTALLLHG